MKFKMRTVNSTPASDDSMSTNVSGIWKRLEPELERRRQMSEYELKKEHETLRYLCSEEDFFVSAVIETPEGWKEMTQGHSEWVIFVAEHYDVGYGGLVMLLGLLMDKERAFEFAYQMWDVGGRI